MILKPKVKSKSQAQLGVPPCPKLQNKKIIKGKDAEKCTEAQQERRLARSNCKHKDECSPRAAHPRDGKEAPGKCQEKIALW